MVCATRCREEFLRVYGDVELSKTYVVVRKKVTEYGSAYV